jgi:hypothetical protein
MAVQEVQVVSSQSSSWASEATLDKLVRAAEVNNDILKRVAKARNIDLDGIRDLNKSSGTASVSTGKLSQQITSTTGSVRDYERSVYDLQRTTRAFNDKLVGTIRGLREAPNIGQVLSNAGQGISQFSAGLAAVGGRGRLAGLTRAIGTAGLVAGAVTSTSAAVIGRFIEAGDVFRDMIESGVIFDGTVSGMIQSVRSTGMSLERAGQLIQSHSEAILITGEQRFFQTVSTMQETFNRMGMDANRGAEALANLTEMQRLSGSLFMLSEQERIRANETMLNQMHAQQRLTGISLRRQQEEQLAVARREKVRILEAGMTGPQREIVAQQRAAMANMGMRPELIEAALLEAFEGFGTREGGMARNLYGAEYERIIQQLRTGATIGGLEQREAFRARSQEVLTGSQRGIALMGESAYAQFIRAQGLATLERGQAGTQAPPGQEDELRGRQEQFERALQGQAILERSTIDLYTTQDSVAKTMGRLEGLLAKAAEGPVALFLSNTAAAATRVADIVKSLEGRSLDSMMSSLATSLATEMARNPEVAAALVALGLGGAALLPRPGGGPGGGPGGSPGGGGGGVPEVIAGFGRGASRVIGTAIGIEQLISAYNAYSQGNYLETAGHLGLAAARNSPVGRVLAGLDFITELATGRGVVARATSMFGGDPAAVAQQAAVQAAAAAQLASPERAPMPAIPSTGSLTMEQQVALEAQAQTIASRIGQMQSQGVDSRNREMIEAMQQLTEITLRLERAMRGVERNTQ